MATSTHLACPIPPENFLKGWHEDLIWEMVAHAYGIPLLEKQRHANLMGPHDQPASLASSKVMRDGLKRQSAQHLRVHTPHIHTTLRYWNHGIKMSSSHRP